MAGVASLEAGAGYLGTDHYCQTPGSLECVAKSLQCTEWPHYFEHLSDKIPLYAKYNVLIPDIQGFVHLTVRSDILSDISASHGNK